MAGRKNEIGPMYRRLRVLEPVTEVDATTNEVLANWWQEFAVTFGQRLSQPINELYEANQMVALNTVRYKARFIDDMTTQMLVQDDQEYYKIIGIETIDRREFMYLTVQKRDNQETINET